MSIVDWVLVAILAFGAIKGYMHGFVVEVFSFFGFFVGLIIALQLTIPVTVRFFSDSEYFDIVAILVFIVLFVLLGLAIKMGARFIKNVLDMTIFGMVDNLIGAVTGIVKWAFLISAVLWVLNSVGVTFEKGLASDSIILPYLLDFSPVVFGWIAGFIPFVQDLIDTMKDIPGSKNTYLSFAL